MIYLYDFIASLKEPFRAPKKPSPYFEINQNSVGVVISVFVFYFRLGRIGYRVSNRRVIAPRIKEKKYPLPYLNSTSKQGECFRFSIIESADDSLYSYCCATYG